MLTQEELRNKMDFKHNNPILIFHPDTLQSVRKLYNLDTPRRLEEAIIIFQEWIKKQRHFTKKDFDRDFLERWLIANKGQLERAKTRLDKICTLRTLLPEYFSVYNVKVDLKEVENMQVGILPKQTDDFYRIFLAKNISKNMSSSYFFNFYRKSIILWEYLLKHDYSVGFIVVLDCFDTNLLDMVTKMDITELRQCATLFLEGYGTRIKDIHILSTSKYVQGLISLFKQVFSSKLSQRIQTHNTVESLQKVLDIDLMPIEYGGKEKPLSELHEKWIEVLSSNEHIEYLKKSYEARTNEANRSVDKFNEQYLGTPGSFRTLVVD